MVAAIYARKSTDQNGIGDEHKSITRQVEHAKAYALDKGWTVATDHIEVASSPAARRRTTRASSSHLHRRWHIWGRVRQASRLLAVDERAQAISTVPGPDHERREPTRP